LLPLIHSWPSSCLSPPGRPHTHCCLPQARRWTCMSAPSRATAMTLRARRASPSVARRSKCNQGRGGSDNKQFDNVDSTSEMSAECASRYCISTRLERRWYKVVLQSGLSTCSQRPSWLEGPGGVSEKSPLRSVPVPDSEPRRQGLTVPRERCLRAYKKAPGFRPAPRGLPFPALNALGCPSCGSCG